MSAIVRHTGINQLWTDLLRDLVDAPATKSRDGMCFETVGWAGGLIDPRCSRLSVPERGWSPGYASAELLWYLMGRNDIAMMAAYAPQYARFESATAPGVATGAYGHRWTDNPGVLEKGWGRTQLQLAREVLMKHSEDRRAVVTMFDSGDLVEASVGAWKDIPCTLSMQFLVRQEKLHLQVSMRSNDAWLGVPYDIHCFTQIQALMAASLQLELGHYTHVVGSMHLYERNLEKARAASRLQFLSNPYCTTPSHEEACDFFQYGVPPWVWDCEEQFRRGEWGRLEEIIECAHEGELGCWWSEKLIACALKLKATIDPKLIPDWVKG